MLIFVLGYDNILKILKTEGEMEMDFKLLPKIELHCHLDGSVRPETVLDIAKEENIQLPTYDIEELRAL